MAIEYFIKEKYQPNKKLIKIGEDFSSNWCFRLFLYKKYVIHSFNDWIPIFSYNSRIIVDQFGTMYLPDTLINIITKRGINKTINNNIKNDATILGPNNLLRLQVGFNNCIGHGEGTWDYIDSLI